MHTVHITITGRVQGVGYRAWFEAMARSLDLNGWVRNRHDGSVEAVVAGDEAAIERLVAACHQGPPAASVDEVATQAVSGPAGDGFVTHPTG